MDPNHHRIYLTVVLSRFPFQAEGTSDDNPWRQQILADVKLLSPFDDVGWIVDAVCADPILLFTDVEVVTAFTAFDVAQIRVVSNKCNIPLLVILCPPLFQKLKALESNFLPVTIVLQMGRCVGGNLRLSERFNHIG